MNKTPREFRLYEIKDYKKFAVLETDFLQLESCRGYKYVLNFIDYNTGWTFSFTVKGIKAQDDIQCLNKIKLPTGLPKVLRSDSGKSFYSKELREYLDKHGCNLVLTASYNPESNGLVERFNQALINTLRIIRLEKQDKDCIVISLKCLKFKYNKKFTSNLDNNIY